GGVVRVASRQDRLVVQDQDARGGHGTSPPSKEAPLAAYSFAAAESHGGVAEVVRLRPRPGRRSLTTSATPEHPLDRSNSTACQAASGFRSGAYRSELRCFVRFFRPARGVGGSGARARALRTRLTTRSA